MPDRSSDYEIPTPLALHYTASSPASQKVKALVGRKPPKRETCSICFFLAPAMLPAVTRQDAEGAIERVWGLSFDDFQSQVVVYPQWVFGWLSSAGSRCSSTTSPPRWRSGEGDPGNPSSTFSRDTVLPGRAMLRPRCSADAAGKTLQRLVASGLTVLGSKTTAALVASAPDPRPAPEYVPLRSPLCLNFHSALRLRGMIEQIPTLIFVATLGRTR